MLRPHAHRQKAAGDSLKHWKHSKEPEEQWRLRPLGAGKHPADDSLLHCQLKRLGKADGKSAPLLDRPQVVIARPTCFERPGETVRGGHRVLDGKINADAAN